MPTPLQAIGLDDWKTQAKAGKAPSECLIRKGFAFDEVVKVEDRADGLLRARFVISMGTVDRDDDTINLNGWDVNDWLKNPQVLWAHDYYGTAVPSPDGIGLTTLGLGEDLTFTDGRMESVVAFQPRELNPLAHTIASLVLHARRFIRAASVGFKPLKWAFNEERERFGVDFLKQLLLEWSICPLGSHPEALSEAKSCGIELAGLKEWAERVLDGCVGKGLWVPKEDAEAAYFIAAGDKKIFIPRGALKGLEAEDVRMVLTGPAELRDVSGAVLRTFGAAAGDAGTVDAGQTNPSAKGREGATDGGAADAGTGGGDPPAGEAAAPSPSGDSTVHVSALDADALAALLESPAGQAAIERAIAQRATPPAPAATATADNDEIDIDETEFRMALRDVLEEELAPLQSALTAVTGHLG